MEHLTDAQLDQMVDFDRESLEVVQQLAAEGKGLLFITAHWGAFDIVTQVLARRNLPMLLLVARFKPPSVAEFLIRLRGQRGMETVLVDDGLAALKRAMQALRNGRLVGMMPDRNIDRTGVMIPFFGDDTVMGTGLAKMALRGQTAVVPGFCRRITRNRYSVYFTPPIYPPREGAEADRVAALTKAVFAVIEQQIARAPEQWTLLQPVWPDAPCPPDPGLAPA